MPNGGMGRGMGMGRGFGLRGGMGFGFRGSSPPWPYVGRGRGGLPRCSYPGAWAVSTYGPAAYTEQVPFAASGTPQDMSYYGTTTVPGTMPFAPQMTKEQELDFLKNQAESIKSQLEQIGARVQELESE